MRYHTVFKFMAVLLCAASLLGILGSGLGIYVMTEAELYHRTVDEVLEDQIQVRGASISQGIAVRYASAELGGVPADFIQQRFPVYEHGVISGNYGYTLTDSQGNVLAERQISGGDNAAAYTFPISGQYLHLISLMTEAEKYHQEDIPQVTAPPESTVAADGFTLYTDIPAEGAGITLIQVRFSDGSSFDHSSDTSLLGTAFPAADGSVICYLDDTQVFLPVNVPILSITLVSGDHMVYEATSTDGTGVGTVVHSAIGRGQVFRSSIAVQNITAAAAEPAALEASVPVTGAEETVATETTVPETTAEETVPETTIPFTPAKVTDNIPKDGIAEVVTLEAEFTNGKKIRHEDEFGIGRIRHKEGDVMFTSYDPWEITFGKVTRIRFLDQKGQVLYEASHEDGIGQLYEDEGHVSFYSAIPEPPVVETVPPTQPPETVPETSEETVPETAAETVPQTTAQVLISDPVAVTEPVYINGKLLQEYDILSDTFYDQDRQQPMYVEYVYTPMPEYTVTLLLTEESLSYGQVYDILRIVRTYRNYLLPLLGGCILLFFLSGVFLICTAGRCTRNDLVQAGGPNRIPLDLYLLIVALGVPSLFVLVAEGSEYLLLQDLMLGCAFAAGLSYAACLLVVGFLFAAVAQWKTGGGFWWRNTLCGHAMRLLLRIMGWLEKNGREHFFPWLGRLLVRAWHLLCACLLWLYRSTDKLCLWSGRKLIRVFRWIGGVIHRFLSLLPLTWQWLVCGFLMFLLLALVFAANGEEILVVLCTSACVCMIVYGAHCFGTLLDSTKKMSKGNLNTKVDDKMMVGAFRDFAGELNALAGVAVVAAQKQLNSERMKSELITNVSHDIKTPLTSIINYVDLLQKPHSQEDEAQYLEVLSRQSLQLKKLLEDLMDMSKASTGNMSVDITRLDAVEAVNQALGEFSDKLDKARLVPVFRHTEVLVPMLADGRLLWRVLSNLLSNVVKYAMPGTRVYLDLMQVEDQVVISIKNISRDELTTDAGELMERFVRGDDSRNTEGSGLGLNIAKSLAELQKGQMQLLVDGDLFKVTLIFPAG